MGLTAVMRARTVVLGRVWNCSTKGPKSFLIWDGEDFFACTVGVGRPDFVPRQPLAAPRPRCQPRNDAGVVELLSTIVR